MIENSMVMSLKVCLSNAMDWLWKKNPTFQKTAHPKLIGLAVPDNNFYLRNYGTGHGKGGWYDQHCIL